MAFWPLRFWKLCVWIWVVTLTSTRIRACTHAHTHTHVHIHGVLLWFGSSVPGWRWFKPRESPNEEKLACLYKTLSRDHDDDFMVRDGRFPTRVRTRQFSNQQQPSQQSHVLQFNAILSASIWYDFFCDAQMECKQELGHSTEDQLHGISRFVCVLSRHLQQV